MAPETCNSCLGEGFGIFLVGSAVDAVETVMDCPDCAGTGVVTEEAKTP